MRRTALHIFKAFVSEYALYCANYASSGAHQKNLKEDRAIYYQRQKCSAGTLLSGKVNFCADSRRFSEDGAF